MRAGRLVLACLLAGVTATVAACGSSSAGGPDTRPSPPAAAGVTVRMTAALAFAPAAVTVAPGDEVTWTNPSQVTHNVKGEAFFSRVIEPGAVYRHRFAKAGSYRYLCTFHPGMEGTVTVR